MIATKTNRIPKSTTTNGTKPIFGTVEVGAPEAGCPKPSFSLEDGELVIRCSLNEALGHASETGKNILLCQSGRYEGTKITMNGREIKVNVLVMVPVAK